MRKLLLVPVALIAVLGVASLASAHTRPVLFDPAPGAVLDTAPTEITGWFNNPLRSDPNWTYLQVFDAQGNRVDSDDVDLSEDRHQMTVGLQPDLEEGAYLVTWRVWDDDDGHILGDCFKFYVGQAAADAAIADGTRLLGGEGCEAIDVSAREGTPTPEELTPTPEAPEATGSTAMNGSGSADSSSGGDDDGDDGGVPIWGLAIGVVAGVVVGGAGARLFGTRA